MFLHVYPTRSLCSIYECSLLHTLYVSQLTATTGESGPMVQAGNFKGTGHIILLHGTYLNKKTSPGFANTLKDVAPVIPISKLLKLLFNLSLKNKKKDSMQT